MAEVHFSNSKKVLYFHDLAVNDNFVVDSLRAQGAVYRKVSLKNNYGGNKTYQMEEATGKLFEPTTSQVKKVNVKVSIEANDPGIY